MVYLLDTSVIIDLLRKKGGIIDFLSSHPDDIFLTSCICEVEVMTGIFRYKGKDHSSITDKTQSIFTSFYEVASFDSQQAKIAGQIKAELLDEGEMIDDLDILIAAATICRQAILITSNLRHFNRIRNLQVQGI